MKEIQAFYALAHKYGFIDFETYIQVIFSLTVSAVLVRHEGLRQPARGHESELLAKVG